MGFVIAATIILILLYKFKCYKVERNDLLSRLRQYHRLFVDHSWLAYSDNIDAAVFLSVFLLQVRA